MNDLHRFLKICLDIAEYYDRKGEIDTDFLGDEMTDKIGLGYRALTGYIRKGVQEVISLEGNYHTVCYQRDYEKSRREEVEEQTGENT